MAELKELIKEDDGLQNLSEEQIRVLKDALLEKRALQAVGSRASNRAAALDVYGTMERINEEVNTCFNYPMKSALTRSVQFEHLSERTGMQGIILVSRGHVDDTFEPFWLTTDNAIDFFNDTMGKNPWDLLRQFEYWICSRSKSKQIRRTLFPPSDTLPFY